MVNQYANDFTRTTEIYFDELKKYKPLTKAKERRLLRKCKKGNLQAKNELLEANLRFVFDIAKHYTGRGLSISELISDGNMGLLKAIEKFDESKDVKFISYAVWWIRQSMLDSIKRKNMINFVDIECDNDTNIFEDKICDDDFEDNVVEYGSLNQIDYNEVNETQREVISKLLNSLDERERDIIENYYGLNDKKELTLTDIGLKYNLSTERVRQIKKKCLRKLRSKILLSTQFEELFS